MEPYGLISFFAIMLLLAAMPSGSVAFVVVSSATRGLPCGLAASLGIVAGDLIFVTFALLGMTALAETMGALFAVFRYLGGAYLIWMGICLIRSTGKPSLDTKQNANLRIVGTFHAALLLTLGDLKAILFYASLFPVFIDVQALTASGVAVIVIITAIAVGSVKVAYAVFAERIASRLNNPRLQKGSRILAGSAMIGAGGVVIAKT